ncbi:9f3cd80b-7070-44d6-9179-bd5584f02769 [Thermothielavioides terrestris]|uniref:9f3cd80b-7070-44d6-9179-bd5584f02769 n=1 Tax=Thermothielavioides terrestris TaxID=2587410 RepID=A0A3S4AKD0_9PEZI|nr:9f3cd80b-7070-44d6-9179-bd5584f02769 [Thermothielavioides terrestris]
MLLTSAQVSVAVSSGIVILCTVALFLSGYALQQRTLRELRAAIKPSPEPSPKIFLPDRFKESTTELEDGTVITLGDDSDDEGNGDTGRNDGQVIEVKPTVPDQTPGQKHLSPEPRAVGGGYSRTSGQSSRAGKKPAKGRKGKGVSQEYDHQQPQKPMSRAERRRRIREEIMKMGQGEDPVGYHQRKQW